jgi:cyclophilin family peptidyl-prolyl cis-trans isomerase
MNLQKLHVQLCRCLLSALLLACCSSFSKAQSDTIVVINTSYGALKFTLYEETPMHKKQFLKLVKTGYYDSLMFHRIIKELMIQGGEPDLRFSNSPKKTVYENPGCILPQEISTKKFHKKGALAAVNQNDGAKSEKQSSVCQFYIVLGKRFSENDFKSLEARRESQLKQKLINKFLEKPENIALHNRYKLHQEARNNDSLNLIRKQLQPFVEQELKNEQIRKFTFEEKNVYSTLGGAPHLDGNYTVFGELIEGWDVLDKIAVAEVNSAGKPKVDISIMVYPEVVK